MQCGCAVAFADRSGLPLEGYASLLSSRETAEALTYTRPERRWRTIASRLLTKYLVAGPKAQPFRRVAAREIEAVPRAQLASIEYLSGFARSRTPPTIARKGRRCSGISASSSHCGPYTASCIGGHRIGVDLERIEPRRSEFYEHTFSHEEQDWVQWITVGSGYSTDAAFTLLWSVKEAFLKASGGQDLTVWSFPRWTVSLGERVREALQAKVADELLGIPGGIRGPGVSQVFELAVTRINDMILAVVQY
jgi:4'-phosphopantetheinyl transferase EntD